MPWIPSLGQRVRSLHSGSVGTVDDVYRTRTDSHWKVDVTLENGVTVTSFLADFAHTWCPEPCNVVHLSDYRERRGLRAMVASLHNEPQGVA